MRSLFSHIVIVPGATDHPTSDHRTQPAFLHRSIIGRSLWRMTSVLGPNGSSGHNVTAAQAASRIAAPSTSSREVGSRAPATHRRRPAAPMRAGSDPMVHAIEPAIGSPAVPRPATQHRLIEPWRIGTDGGSVEVGDRTAIGELDRQTQEPIGGRLAATVVRESETARTSAGPEGRCCAAAG